MGNGGSYGICRRRNGGKRNKNGGNRAVSPTGLARAAFPLLGSAWVRRITFGPNPAKNETLGARLGEKSPAGVQKAVLGGLLGGGRLELLLPVKRMGTCNKIQKEKEWPLQF